MEKHLKWEKHTNSVIRRCKYQLRSFYRAIKFLDFDEKRLLYNACLATRLSYADIIWNQCSLNQRKRLQTIQNMAARGILCCDKFEHAMPLIKELNWITLDQKRKLHEMVMFYKIYHNTGTEAQEKRLREYHITPTINTRGMGASQLFIPTHGTKYKKDSFYVRNIKAWNRLPASLKDVNNANTFKTKLAAHFYREQHAGDQ